MFCGNDSSQHIQIMPSPLSTLSRRVSGDSAQALRHNKNGVQTAFKRQANSQTTLLTACTPHYFNFGAGALQYQGKNGARRYTQPIHKSSQSILLKHVPAPSQITLGACSAQRMGSDNYSFPESNFPRRVARIIHSNAYVHWPACTHGRAF